MEEYAVATVRIEKWGDSYRLVELFNPTPDGTSKQPDVHERSPNEEDLHYMEEFYKPEEEGEATQAARFQSSIIRARSRVRELALCQHWDYFATFTLAEKKQDRFDLSGFIKDLGNWIRNYRKKYGSQLQYLIIPEQHKDGAWHAHGLLRNVAPDSLVKNEHGYLDMPYYRARFGYISLSKVKSHERCASYITKYISKDVEATADHMKKGQHLFYSSRGLAGKEILWVVTCPGHIQGGFKNEYGIFKWVKFEEVRHIIERDVRHREKVLHSEGGHCAKNVVDHCDRAARGGEGRAEHEAPGSGTQDRPQRRPAAYRLTRRYHLRGAGHIQGRRVTKTEAPKTADTLPLLSLS
jgi:hypothetical protein